MLSKLSILIPTRKRPKQLREVLENLRDNVEYRPLHVEVGFDGDEDGARGFGWSIFDRDFPGSVYFFARGEYISTVNNLARIAYSRKTAYFMPWSDDSYLLGHRPLCRAIDALNANSGLQAGNKPCLLAMNNPYWGYRLATHAILNREMVDWLNYGGGAIFYPGYKHYAGDNELTALAKRDGYFYFLESVRVEHPPPTETQENPSMKWKKHDREVWLERKEEMDL